MSLITVSPGLEFTKGFPIGPTIDDTDRALYVRFQAAGNLAQTIDFIAEHEQGKDEPSLGVLDTTFIVGSPKIPFALRNSINLSPIAANKDILLGCFGLASLVAGHQHPKIKDTVDLFGTLVTIASSNVGYAGLERQTVKAATGIGFMKYTGKVAVFESTPDFNELWEFATAAAPNLSNPNELSPVRVDATVIPAWKR